MLTNRPEGAQVKRRLILPGVITAGACVITVATLPSVPFSTGFLAYAAVLSVAFVLLTWNRSQAWFTLWGGVLPGSTMAWATRTFYDSPSIFSLTGLHIVSLYLAVFGVVVLLSRYVQNRLRPASQPLHQPDGG